MECNKTQELLHAHIDQELGLLDAIEIDKHLQACPACHRDFVRQNALRAALKKEASYFQVPSHLESRIRAALALENDPLVRTTKRRWKWVGSGHWFNVGATFASAVAVLFSLSLYLITPSPYDLLAEEVVSSHVRSLMVAHLSDVASTDKHTVKPWFSGKLDFSPPVQDLAKEGFPLVGGRLDYLNQRPVAALVYRRQQHTINLYVWPSSGITPHGMKLLSRQGFNMTDWSDSGMQFWAVSDLNSEELKTFTQLLRQKFNS
jgi:anti-sigma factor RsiW